MKILSILALALLSGTLASSQTITGTILGSVTDPAGGSIGGARIEVHNTATGVRTSAASNAAGEYTIPLLPAGRYTVEIAAAGFQTFSTRGVTLTVDGKVRVDARMVVGQATQTVQVSGQAQPLQSDASDLNSSLSARAIENLPNIGKNPLQYLVTAPGVVPRAGFDDPNNFNSGDDARRTYSNFSVNGAPPIMSEILLDGAPNTTSEYNEVAVLPNTDALQELKIITNAYSAEFGRAGGGVVELAVKSGTNRLHGLLYDYARNKSFNSNTFGNNSFGQNPDGTPVRKKGQFNVQQFGGTLGGPVLVPKLYDGKNKTFFFFSYEGLRRAQDASQFLTVPTLLERQGDFSQSKVLVGNQVLPIQIYNPVAAATTVTTVSAGNVRLDRQQFSDGGVLNKIPARFLNPVALKYLGFYPKPNIAPLNPDGTGNYFLVDSNRNVNDQTIVRLDHAVNERHRLFGHATYDWSTANPANVFKDGNPQAANVAPTSQKIPTVTLGYTWTVSPTSIVDARANLTRVNVVQATNLNNDLVALGFSPALAAAAPTAVLPRVLYRGSVPGGNFGNPEPGIGLNSFAVRDDHATDTSYTASYTKILNAVTLKVGGEFRNYLSNFFAPFSAGIGFSPRQPTTSTALGVAQFTQPCVGAGCPTDTPNNGSTLADFLIGAAPEDQRFANGQISSGDPHLAVGTRYYALFTQNDWKATRKLTVNLGMRWEFQGPSTERYNRLSQFDPSRTNFAGAPGVFQFPGVNGIGTGQTEPHHDNFAPRVGVAYRPFGNTVMRAAYGITYLPVTGYGAGANGFGTTGFSNPAFINILPASGPNAGLDILNAPFPQAFSGGGTVIGADPKNPAFLGISPVTVIRNQGTPYMQQWNATLEHQFASVNVQASYVGSKGTRLPFGNIQPNGDYNIPQAQLDGARASLTSAGIDPLSTLVPNPYYGVIPPANNPSLSGPTIQERYLLRPYPTYGNIQFLNQRGGSSTYNAAQIVVRRTFTSGLELGGNYTFSKNIDNYNPFQVNGSNNTANGSGQVMNPSRLDLEKSVANSDQTNRAVFYYVWDLPFGKGKRWFDGTPVVSRMLGGFKVAGITTFASGLPLNITGGGFGRPDLIADPVLPDKYRCFGDGVKACPLPDGTSVVVPNRRLLYFNPHAFANALLQLPPATAGGAPRYMVDPYHYGSAPRYFSDLRGFGTHNWDLTLSRVFPIRERLRLEFQAQAVNLFNRTTFGDGGINKGLGSVNLTPSAGPVGLSTDRSFGTADVTSLNKTPRYLQLALRLSF